MQKTTKTMRTLRFINTWCEELEPKPVQDLPGFRVTRPQSDPAEGEARSLMAYRTFVRSILPGGIVVR